VGTVDDGREWTLLAAIAAFALGGTLDRELASAASVLTSLGTAGAIVGAAIGAIHDRDIPRWGAIGGGIGLALGVLALVFDAALGA